MEGSLVSVLGGGGGGGGAAFSYLHVGPTLPTPLNTDRQEYSKFPTPSRTAEGSTDWWRQ